MKSEDIKELSDQISKVFFKSFVVILIVITILSCWAGIRICFLNEHIKDQEKRIIALETMMIKEASWVK